MSNYIPSLKQFTQPQYFRPSQIQTYRHSYSPQMHSLHYQFKIFQSQSPQQYFLLLKRLHQSIPNTPQLLKLKQDNKKIYLQLKIYNNIWTQYLSQQKFQQKIKNCIMIIKAYLELIKEYGLFMISVNHIKINVFKEPVIWIHQNFFQNKCCHPLENGPQNECKVVDNFIRLIQPCFIDSLFKNKKINNLTALLQYLQFVNKRNMIHKKCTFIAKQKQNKRKLSNNTNMKSPIKKQQEIINKKDHVFYRSQGDVNGFKTINNIRKPQYRTSIFKSNHNLQFYRSKQARITKSPIKKQQHNVIKYKNTNYLQLSSFFTQKTTKQSTDTFSPVSPTSPNRQSSHTFINNNLKISPIQHSTDVFSPTCTSRPRQTKISYNLSSQTQDQFIKLFDNISSTNKISMTRDQQENNILQRDINNLLLSQIHQGQENQMKACNNYQNQLLDQFSNILY